MSRVKLLRATSASSTLFLFCFLPCRSIYSNSPPTRSPGSSRHLKTSSITELHIKHLKKKKKAHPPGNLSTKEPKEGSHLLPLDDKSRGLGHFDRTPLIRTLACPACPRGALAALAAGSFQLEASLDLEGAWTFAGRDPDSDRGGSAAPRARLLHPGSV